ncbi:MAG: hypothetical protein EBZ17_04165 [Actinobacteria bacterium]|jgi:ABC-type branched-subunit amino acid transport system substrate-binding protein|nr:hypothetical protein [Actinomycetota bacterium]
MQSNQSRWLRLLAVLLAFVLVAAACGDDDETSAESSDDTASDAADDDGGSAADSGDDSAEDTADDEPAAAPLKIGMIAQTEELLAFPEVPAAAEAVVGYANAEDGGNIELVICSAGDAPESHVGCAQEFANDDSINLVISAGFLANSAAANDVLVGAGMPILTLGNDFIDYLTPGVFTVDPGLPGLAQVFFVFAAGEGISNGTLFIADDPAFEPFIPALEAIGDANGIAINEVVPLGFEPDLTGPVSAANPDNEMWMFVLADGAQCTAAAAAVDTVGYAGRTFANDLCMAEDVVSSGALDGWSGPIVSSAPTVDGGDEVAMINRILDEYGGSDAQNAGLSGWSFASTWVARDVLETAGAGASRDDVAAVLGTYSSSEVPGLDSVTCPGPSAWTGACNMAPLMVTVSDGQLTSPDGFVQLDFSELDFLLG